MLLWLGTTASMSWASTFTLTRSTAPSSGLMVSIGTSMPTATLSHLLLTHVADAWGVELPKRDYPHGEPYHRWGG